MSLDRSWPKKGFEMNITQILFLAVIDKIVHLINFNKLKDVMIRLLQNTLYFRNVTYHGSTIRTVAKPA